MLSIKAGKQSNNWFYLHRNPNTGNAVPVTWPRYNTTGHVHLRLAMEPKVEHSLRERKVAFWNEFVPKLSEKHNVKAKKLGRWKTEGWTLKDLWITAIWFRLLKWLRSDWSVKNKDYNERIIVAKFRGYRKFHKNRSYNIPPILGQSFKKPRAGPYVVPGDLSKWN